MSRSIILAITGATGAIYGLRLLQVLKTSAAVDTHLIITPAGAATIRHELDMEPGELKALATVSYGYREIGAPIASGSFPTDGMVIAPCSMNSLAAIAHGLSANLVTRAADVILKERRRLILLARETPLSLVHLRNMTAVTEMGGLVAPPAPAFYNGPETIADMVNHTVGRTLDLLGLPELAADLVTRWQGFDLH